MNINYKNLINEYRNYLIMLKVNTTKVNMSIKSIDDIKIYEEECKLNLNKLETLSKDHKLYEKDYDDFRVSMGKFAIGLSKFHKLKISDKEKLKEMGNNAKKIVMKDVEDKIYNEVEKLINKR